MRGQRGVKWIFQQHNDPKHTIANPPRSGSTEASETAYSQRALTCFSIYNKAYEDLENEKNCIKEWKII